MNIILFGPPGAGKGTQASHLEKKWGLIPISTGNLLRQAVKDETEIGVKVKKIMEDGQLVPDDIMISMIAEHMDQYNRDQGFILDGFPRTVQQATALDDMLKKRQRQLDLVVEIHVLKRDLVERIVGRFHCNHCGTTYHDKFNPPEKEGVCDKCNSTDFGRRKDDTVEVVEKRYENYQKLTAPVLPYYQDKNILVKVDGRLDINKVSTEIDDYLSQHTLTYNAVSV